MPEIKRGDRLIAKIHGQEIPVEAASGVKDRTLQIKYKGTFSTISVADVRLTDTGETTPGTEASS